MDSSNKVSTVSINFQLLHGSKQNPDSIKYRDSVISSENRQTQKKEPICYQTGSFKIKIQTASDSLFNVTFLTLGRPAHLRVTRFTRVMKSFFSIGSGSVYTVASGTLGGLKTFVVAGGTVSDPTLVSSMLKSNCPHACFKLDFSRTVVGQREHGGHSNQTDYGQQNNNFFHFPSP
jgi:hypothetical protein